MFGRGCRTDACQGRHIHLLTGSIVQGTGRRMGQTTCRALVSSWYVAYLIHTPCGHLDLSCNFSFVLKLSFWAICVRAPPHPSASTANTSVYQPVSFFIELLSLPQCIYVSLCRTPRYKQHFALLCFGAFGLHFRRSQVSRAIRQANQIQGVFSMDAQGFLPVGKMWSASTVKYPPPTSMGCCRLAHACHC